ncbi:uncharacterized protein [Glycine max]|uniref:uncharacterized protein n=1 Tax=Glycine max TaxID=3847 RepID=UPI001B35705D|nr:uncharacterized protein LOC102659870 [Glycine max]
MGKHSTQFSALNYIDLALDLDAIFFIGQKCLESPLQLCVCCSMKVNADLDMELNPQAQPWPYQPKSLNRMFRNVLLIFILWCARHRRLCDYGRKGSSTRSCIYHIKGLACCNKLCNQGYQRAWGLGENIWFRTNVIKA